jgi:hypothetical protein
VLLERSVRRVFNRNGRCWQRVTYCRPIAATEYDAASDADCAAGRPPSLRRSLGDLRTGAQLLDELAADQRLTLERMRGSRRGRAWLGQLAAEVRRRFEPRLPVQAAADEDAAWARVLIEHP